MKLRHGQMYAYGQVRVAKGENRTAREVSEACKTTIARHEPAVRRCKSLIPKQMTGVGADQTMLVSPAAMSVHAKRSRANEPMS